MNFGVIQWSGDGVIEDMICSRLFDIDIAHPALVATMMMVATACTPIGVLNATAPRSGIAISRDIAYGDNPRQRLDVYAPKAAPAGTSHAPVVVFLYGGGWTEGAKKQYGFVARALASRGIVAVLPDYRLYPEVRFPAFIEDAAAATRWACPQLWRRPASSFRCRPFRRRVHRDHAGARPALSGRRRP